MKKLHLHFMAAIALVAAAIALTSCSDSTDADSPESPAHLSDAAKYDITTPGALYNSIELTASGYYIVSSEMSNSSVPPATEPKSRAYSAGTHYGKFTKISDSEYRLSNFGTIKIADSNGTSCTLEISSGSSTHYYQAALAESLSQSAKTERLCRTWAADKVDVKMWKDGGKIADKSFSKYQYDYVTIAGYRIEIGNYIENVVFTPFGTYLAYYIDGTIDVATWKWENEKKGIARYSYNPADMYDADNSGEMALTFSGNNARIVTTDEYKFLSNKIKQEMVLNLVELK